MEISRWAMHVLRNRTRRVPGFRKAVPNDPLAWGPYIYLGAWLPTVGGSWEKFLVRITVSYLLVIC